MDVARASRGGDERRFQKGKKYSQKESLGWYKRQSTIPLTICRIDHAKERETKLAPQRTEPNNN
jgi:hypothetical protein